MARVASVTVSIAAESIGIFKLIFFVKLVRISVSRGRTSENAGNNKTSSNVRPSPKNFGGILPEEEFILAMCKDSTRDKLLPNPIFSRDFSVRNWPGRVVELRFFQPIHSSRYAADQIFHFQFQ